MTAGAQNVTSLTGSENLPIDNGGPLNVEITAQSLRQLKNTKYNTNTATGAATLTAASISGGLGEVTLNMTGTLGAGAALTLPTVADLVAALPAPIANQSYKLRVINSSSGAFTWTVTTNTGWTLAGTMTIAQNTWRDFYVTLTSLTAATLQAVGTGTQS